MVTSYAYSYPHEQVITPKAVRDALKALKWPRERDMHEVGETWPWARYVPSFVCAIGTCEHYRKRRDYFRSLTIEQVAAPVPWTLVCALWTSRSMRHVRDLYAVDSAAALHEFATTLCIHLSSDGSPLQRMQQYLQKVGVKPTDEQKAAQARAEAREAATTAGAQALLASARWDHGRLTFDARHLFGTLTALKAEYVRFRYHDMVATVRRVWLDDGKKALLAKPKLLGWIAPIGDDPTLYQLSLHWTNKSGTHGGLNLRIGDEIHDDWCTVVDFGVAELPSALE